MPNDVKKFLFCFGKRDLCCLVVFPFMFPLAHFIRQTKYKCALVLMFASVVCACAISSHVLALSCFWAAFAEYGNMLCNLLEIRKWAMLVFDEICGDCISKKLECKVS